MSGWVRGRQPMYELEHWATKLGPRVVPGNGAGHGLFDDDRFGRALDKLYLADMASLTTETGVQSAVSCAFRTVNVVRVLLTLCRMVVNMGSGEGSKISHLRVMTVALTSTMLFLQCYILNGERGFSHFEPWTAKFSGICRSAGDSAVAIAPLYKSANLTSDTGFWY